MMGIEKQPMLEITKSMIGMSYLQWEYNITITWEFSTTHGWQ